MRNQMPDGAVPPLLLSVLHLVWRCTVRQMRSRSSSAFLYVEVLGQQIEIPQTPVGSIYALTIDRGLHLGVRGVFNWGRSAIHHGVGTTIIPG